MSCELINDDLTYCWLDCDPGHDDAMAIILATHSSNIKLIGVSTVSGNQSIEKITKNALNVFNLVGLVKEPSETFDFNNNSNKILNSKLFGVGYPLIRGSSKPLIREPVNCEEIHGESGLETHSSTKFPELPNFALEYVKNLNSSPIHFTYRIYEYLKSSPKRVTFITTGPLTNLALLLICYPDCVEYIEKLVMMGGACGIGNTGPVAEFNIQVDPESAHVVFESNIPIYMVPLEVTHTALVTQTILERISSISSDFSKIIIDLLLFFKSTYKIVFRMDDPPLHDPCAVAFVVNPSIFETRLMRVDIERASHLSYGQTVCDIYEMSNKRKNVHVCLRMDVDKFWNLMIDAIKLADSNSPLNKIIK